MTLGDLEGVTGDFSADIIATVLIYSKKGNQFEDENCSKSSHVMSVMSCLT